MYAIEFESELTDGAIKVPKGYQAGLTGQLKAPQEIEPQAAFSSYLQHLLDSPLEAPNFKPMTREEIYAGRG